MTNELQLHQISVSEMDNNCYLLQAGEEGLLVDAAGRESRELDELEPRELKELWATAVGAMAAMASTAAVAKWKVFID